MKGWMEVLVPALCAAVVVMFAVVVLAPVSRDCKARGGILVRSYSSIAGYECATPR